MSAEDVIALHTASEYTVDMVGFTPGFAFIGGLDERLHVPRRKEPRQRVEAGSVGIADGRTHGEPGWLDAYRAHALQAV
jgi:allophanate hydrolase subunit 1